jgi:cysteine-rich repeat protein
MVWAATCATVAACVAPATTPCADGSLCAPSDVCAPSGQGCADRDQVEACQDLGPDEPCDLGPLGVGLCTDGVCVPSGCGNEALELGEACDDGNRVSGDGCRADCGKVEVCGDQVLDDGEACDDGNLNDADACSDACAAVVWSASSRLAGAPQGTDVGLVHPIGVAFDLHGNVYVAETNGSRIRRVDGGTGEIVVVAGTGTHGYDGDGGPATAARIGAPHGLVLDGLGNLFFADAAMRVVRRVDAATGRISTIAGTGASGSSGDGGPASAARFIEPSGLELDGLGALYVSDAGAHRVRKIAGGVITTIAGTGTSGGSGDGGPAISAQLSGPRGLAVAADGTLYVSDPGNDRLRVIAPDGQIASLAAGEGLTNPADVALAPDGTPLVLDYDRARVYRVDRATGDLSAVVGDGGIAFAGDGGPATAARLAYPSGLAADGRGRLAIADTVNQRIRLVDEDGVISTIIGDGHLGDTGDDGAATSALLRRPVGMAVGADGALYIADTEQHSVRRVDPDGVITTIAGTGRGSFGGDGGPATGAGLDLPSQLALDGDGGLLIADRANHRVRRLDLATGIISTIAGTGSAGSAGDGGDATAATLREPTGVAVGPDGTIYVSDTGSHRVRQIVDGTITAVAGTGSAGSAGDGGAPTSAQLNLPTGLAVGADGALYIADRGNDRVRRIGDGVITSIAGPGPGEGGLDGPCGVAVDASDRVFVADTLRHRVVRVEPGGAVTVIAGQGYSGFFGDGGPATGSALVWPQGVALAPSGELYIVDTYPGLHPPDRRRRSDHHGGRAGRSTGRRAAGAGAPGVAARAGAGRAVHPAGRRRERHGAGAAHRRRSPRDRDRPLSQRRRDRRSGAPAPSELLDRRRRGLRPRGAAHLPDPRQHDRRGHLDRSRRRADVAHRAADQPLQQPGPRRRRAGGGPLRPSNRTHVRRGHARPVRRRHRQPRHPRHRHRRG